MLQLEKVTEVRKNNDWHYRECIVLYNEQRCGHLIAIIHKHGVSLLFRGQRVWDRKEIERRANQEAGKYTSMAHFMIR